MHRQGLFGLSKTAHNLGMMTQQEHTLIVTMLTLQEQKIEALLRILESREIIQGDDRKAFLEITEHDATNRKEILDKMSDNYFKVAKLVNVTLPIDHT